MKYRLLLRTLKILIYTKRFFWWIGRKIYPVLAKIAGFFWHGGGFIYYKLRFLLKKSGIEGLEGWVWKRRVLQSLFFVLLFIIAIPETKLYSQKPTYITGQNTIAFNLFGGAEDLSLEEVVYEEPGAIPSVPGWRSGTLQGSQTAAPSQSGNNLRATELATTIAGNTALSKPMIMPGSSFSGGRSEVVGYEVEPGDSLSSIAYEFGVSVPTIMWENNLSLRSIIRPGDALRIPPATGIVHAIKRGDTLKKIAGLYEADIKEIIKFNKLKEDGSDLVAGEKIMIPGGIRREERSVARAPRSYAPFRRIVAAPPASRSAPSLAGFIWPAGSKLITQYYNWRHYALDIAGGKMGTPIYASKAGTVEKAQCGWNSGYGCMVLINHGGGIKTLYGHNSRLLVSPGDYVSAGQTISLMGNTGRVYGRTGIHLHFEIWSNGAKLNPLGYVR